MARDPAGYTTKIKDYVRRYATDSSSAISASPIGRFDDMKEPNLGPRKDTGTTIEDTTSRRGSRCHDMAVDAFKTEENGYMSDASELSDL